MIGPSYGQRGRNVTIMVRAAILVSGEGRRMRALLDSAFFHEIDNLEIAGVICSDPEAPALRSARSSNVPAYVVEEHLFPNIGSYGLALLNMLKDIDTDLVVLAGFTPGLGPALARAPGKTLEKRAILIPTCNQYVSCNPFVILLS